MSKSFRQQLVNLGLKYIVLPFVVILLFSLVVTYFNVLQESHRTNENTLEILSLQIDHYLQHPIDELEQMYIMWNTQTLAVEESKNFFQYIDRVEVLDADGYIIYTYPNAHQRLGFDASRSDAYQVDLIGQPQVLGTVYDIVAGQPSLSIVMKNAKDERIVAILNLNKLRAFVNELFENVDQEILIVDNNGTIIIDNTNNYVATRVTFPPFNKMVNKNLKPRSVITFNESPVVAYYRELHNTSWYLIVLNLRVTILFETFIHIIPYLILALFLPGLMIGFKRSSTRFSKAFDKTLSLAHKIAIGQYNLPDMEANYLEFQQLHDNFLFMAKQIQKREAEIKQLNIELEALVATKEIDLQQAIDQLGMTQEQLFKAEKARALQALVSGMTHELNTPLGIAITLSTHLEHLTQTYMKTFNSTLNHQDKAYFKDTSEVFVLLNKNLNYLAQLIDSFKRIAVNQERQNIECFNLKDYFDDIVIVHKSELSKDNVKMITHTPSIMLKSYPDLFGKLLSILIKNSLDHGFSKQSYPRQIALNTKIDQGILLITYQDNGSGIPQDILTHIFDPFVTSNRGAGNTGLGMSILYSIVVEYFNGDIRVNNLAQGVVFTIQIPLTLSKEDDHVYQTLDFLSEAPENH